MFAIGAVLQITVLALITGRATNVPLPVRTFETLPSKLIVAILPTEGTVGIATYVPLPVNRLLTFPSKLIVAILPTVGIAMLANTPLPANQV